MAVKKEDKNQKKTALIIGGAGFIGSYVCESLLAQNIEVYAVDDLSSGKEEYIEKLKKDKNFTFLHADVNEGLNKEQIPALDYIFHIGGIESYINGHDLTIKTMLVNSIGTYKTLELARENPHTKYLLVSALDIYNGVLSSLNMSKYYGISDRDNRKYTHHEAKRYAEALLSEYVNKFDLDGRIVRLADVYGPRMDLESGTEISEMIKETIQGDVITINGDGLKIIRPTYVADVVSGITKAMFAEETKGKIYNLVSTTEINVLNLAYTIQKNSTKAIKIQFNQNYTEIKFPAHKVELEQTQHDLGWQAKTELSEGITQTLEYYFMKSETKSSKKTTDEDNRAKIEKSEISNNQNKNQMYLKNDLTKKVEALPKTTQELPNQEKNEKKNKDKSKYINIGLIAFSFFTILLLFIFPLAALFITTGNSFAKTQETLTAYQTNPNTQTPIPSALDAQKNIQSTLSQYDSLEWFFSMTRQREKFETARGKLNAADNLNKAIALTIRDNNTTGLLLQNIITGNADSKEISTLETQKNEIIRLLENSSIDLIDESVSVPFNLQTGSLNAIIEQADELINAIKNNVVIKNNVIKFLLPATEKNYLILFIDNRTIGYEGGKPIGAAIAKINNSGIQEISFNSQRIAQATTIDQAISAAREYAKSINVNSIEGVLLANTTAQKRIIAHIDQVNVKTYAELINAKNYSQKVESIEAKSELQFELWKELWTKLHSGNIETVQSIGQGLRDAIQSQNMKLVSVSSEGVYGLPLCETDHTLYNNFVEPYSPIQLDPQLVYCINLAENSESKNDNTKIKRSLKTQIEKSNAKVTYFFDNKDNNEYVGTLQIMLPQEAKLTNVQVDFPISFDKVRTVKANKYTAYIISVSIKALESKEIIIEWTDENMQSQPISDIYVTKPFGTTIESNSVDVKGIKSGTTQTKNRDAIAIVKNQ